MFVCYFMELRTTTTTTAPVQFNSLASRAQTRLKLKLELELRLEEFGALGAESLVSRAHLIRLRITRRSSSLARSEKRRLSSGAASLSLALSIRPIGLAVQLEFHSQL